MKHRKPTTIPLNKIQQAVLATFVRLKEYTLTIRRDAVSRPKRVQVKASTYKQAVDIACARYRGKWINFSLAKKMDLISARVDAAKLSRTSKNHEAFVILRKDEFIVEPSYGSKDDVYAKYKSGTEDKAFLDSLKPTTSKPTTPSTNDKPVTAARKIVDKVSAATTTKTIKNMATTKEATKKTAKKAVKKSTPSKASAKGAPVKRARHADGKKVTMTNAQMTARIKKGYSYFNPAGVNKTKYIPERPNQDLVNEDYYEVAPSK